MEKYIVQIEQDGSRKPIYIGTNFDEVADKVNNELSIGRTFITVVDETGHLILETFRNVWIESNAIFADNWEVSRGPEDDIDRKIPMLSGHPNRDTAISEEDINNLKIALDTDCIDSNKL